MNNSKRELTCLVNSLRDFLKTFDHASKCKQTPLPKPKVEIESTESKNILFAQYCKDIIDDTIEHPTGQFRLAFDLETTILAYFLSKNLSFTAINFFLQKLSILTIGNFTVSTRSDITLQTSVEELRAITMCSIFTPNCGYDNSTIILIGDVYCPNTKCSGKLCPHKKTFETLE